MTRKEFFTVIGNSMLALGLFRNSWLHSTMKKRSVAMNKGLKLSYEIKRLVLKHTWTISRNSSDYKDNIIIKVEKDGITGYGEAAPNIRYNETPESTVAVVEKAIPLFAQANPWQFVDLGFAIQKLDPAQTAAKAGMDLALMDWMAKSLGIPFYKYLGLDKTKAPVTTFTIGIDTPEMIKQKVLEAEPYPVLKIKVGRENDEEIIAAVRSVTDKPLRVDANEGWKVKEEALDKIQWLATQNVEFIEQPMPASRLDDIRWLRERVNIPLIADESVKTASDIPQLATAFDGINIKLMKAGGLQEGLRMVWLAKSLGMKVMLGCMIETSIAIAAGASISPLIDYADLDGNLLIANDPFDGHQVERGQIILNDRPGLGVVPK